MQKSNPHIKADKHLLSFFRTSLNISFIVFFAFLFTYLHTASAANAPVNEKDFSKYSNATLKNNKDQQSTHPFHIPFESDSSENESLDSKKDERDEQHQEYDSFFTYSYSCSLKISDHAAGIKAGASLQPGCDHNTVPLFILHHSWKSYLLS